MNDIDRNYLYDNEMFSTLLKKCIAKKEANLEKGAGGVAVSVFERGRELADVCESGRAGDRARCVADVLHQRGEVGGVAVPCAAPGGFGFVGDREEDGRWWASWRVWVLVLRTAVHELRRSRCTARILRRCTRVRSEERRVGKECRL